MIFEHIGLAILQMPVNTGGHGSIELDVVSEVKRLFVAD